MPPIFVHLSIAYILIQFMFFALICSTGGFGGLGLRLLNPKILIKEGAKPFVAWVLGIVFNISLIPYAIIYWLSVLGKKFETRQNNLHDQNGDHT